MSLLEFIVALSIVLRQPIFPVCHSEDIRSAFCEDISSHLPESGIVLAPYTMVIRTGRLLTIAISEYHRTIASLIGVKHLRFVKDSCHCIIDYHIASVLSSVPSGIFC